MDVKETLRSGLCFKKSVYFVWMYAILTKGVLYGFYMAGIFGCHHCYVRYYYGVIALIYFSLFFYLFSAYNSRMTEKKERIAKKMADAGLCSRREAERWILAGRVSVKGVKLETPACAVDDSDEVLVDGKPLARKEKTRVWIYHKPVGLVTTHRDPQGRPTVFSNLPKSLPRVISVGRLDLNSEGLLLLTNSGEWARKMELPSSQLKRTYRVRVHGKITPEIVSRLKKGVTIEGVKYAPALVEVEKTQGTNTWLRVTLSEGKNREIRRLMAFFGIEVARLIRTSYGPYRLDDLKVGTVKEVPCALFQA